MYMSNLSGNDLVYYKENNRIMSGGFNINSILMKQNISPSLTMNNGMQTGGSAGSVSNLFKSLAVPTGLLYLHERKQKHNHMGFQMQVGGKKKTNNDNKSLVEKEKEKENENEEKDDDDDSSTSSSSSSNSSSSSSSNSSSNSESASDMDLDTDEVLTEEIFKKCFDLVAVKASHIKQKKQKKQTRRKKSIEKVNPEGKKKKQTRKVSK